MVSYNFTKQSMNRVVDTVRAVDKMQVNLVGQKINKKSITVSGGDTYKGMFKIIKDPDVDTNIKIIDGSDEDNNICGKCLVTDTIFDVQSISILITSYNSYIIVSSEYDETNDVALNPIIELVTDLSSISNTKAFGLIGRIDNDGNIIQESHGMPIIFHTRNC